MTAECELLQLSLIMNNKTRDQKSPLKLCVSKEDPNKRPKQEVAKKPRRNGNALRDSKNLKSSDFCS